MDNSKVVIGTWALSGDYGYVNLETINEVLTHSYYTYGFKEFDTAPSYGNGFIEFCLGNIFYKKDVLINTKMGNIPFMGKSFKIGNLLKSFRESLKRLKRDNINILFLHNPRDGVNYDAIFEFMDFLKKQGEIKYSGLSKAKNFPYGNRLLDEFDVIQDDINLLSMPFTISSETVFMARSVLASGLLSDSMTKDRVFEEGDVRAEWLTGERLEYLLSMVENIRKIIIPYNLPLATVAKRFVLHCYMDKVIFGVKHVSHLIDLMGDLYSPLPDKLVEELVEGYSNNYGIEYNKKYAY